jgi:hypothetical protein
MKQFGLIPRNRLSMIPADLRGNHEYCFFLHDQCVAMMKEYEAAKAHFISYEFRDNEERAAFEKLAGDDNSFAALRATGRDQEAKRLAINMITLTMVSDCLHHVYEGLVCFEKRKVIVALNLLRKPLKDSLSYLSWILGDEDGFYDAFRQGPDKITVSKVGNLRPRIFEQAMVHTDLAGIIDPAILQALLFERGHPQSFDTLFQHAVHLVTVHYEELKTAPENFNFIFKSYADDDLYEHIYGWLPYIMLYLSHVIAGLFERMRNMDEGSNTAFTVRSVAGLPLVLGGDLGAALEVLEPYFVEAKYGCPACKTPLKLTSHNLGRLLFTEAFKCMGCGRKHPFPFSWLF